MFFFFFFPVQIYSGNLAPLQRLVEDTNDQASDFTANAVAMSRQTLSRLEDINTRFEVRIFQNIFSLFLCETMGRLSLLPICVLFFLTFSFSSLRGCDKLIETPLLLLFILVRGKETI